MQNVKTITEYRMQNTGNNYTKRPVFFKKTGLNSTNQAFTLVELIVVITILAILGTISFISFQGYTTNARDGVRIADINSINKGLALYQLKGGVYPKPDNYITISASGTTIGYEGTVGENVSRIININKIILDPLDDIPYIYYTNATNTAYQLLWYLEGNLLTQNSLINTTYAATDYTKRYPKVQGDNLGILLDNFNNPITTDIDLFGSQSGTIYNSYISNAIIKTLSGVELGGPLITLSRSLNFGSLTTCPEGFIKVPGNEEFMQSGFCVAKYEMTYVDADIPDACDLTCPVAENITGQTDRNTVAYTGTKIPVSIPGKYPIAKITQIQAIDACKSMGEGYHLITNNEWMTIARNIEANPINWSTNTIGTGYIYNGVSNSTMGCLSTDGPDSDTAVSTDDIYTTLTRNRATKTGGGFGNTDCDIKRQLKLSNGEIIWDLSGNVWEHVNKANTIDGTNYNLGQTSIIGSSNGSNWDDDGILDPKDDMKKYSSNLGLGILNGMGNIRFANGVSNNIFLRGAHSDIGSNVGVFTTHLNWISTGQARSVGFRCAK